MTAPAKPGRDLGDGQWHRVHPATPLLKGGLVFLAVLGYVIANLRERLIDLFLPEEAHWDSSDNDPVQWAVENNLVLLILLGVVLILAVIIGAFYLSWRFHSFRISAAAVEVRKGVIARQQRRAPLDRVQGVNLTRPFLARMIGLAKLEIVGAGTDANVPLEYLRTADAEQVRADILRLASGLRAQRSAQHGGGAQVPQRASDRLVQTVGAGLTGLVDGPEQPAAEPASVVKIPIGRMILSHIASPGTLFLILYVVAAVIAAVFGAWVFLFGIIPGVFAVGAFWVNSLTKTLRYSIAPTPDGLRVTFGLTTTITETIPPGRIHALEISQSVFWRPMGWWRIRINRLTGRSATQQTTADAFTTLLPIGTAEDVARVLALALPEIAANGEVLFRQGMDGPQPGDPFTNTPARARVLRPFSWKRNGFLLLPQALLMRRGVIWRSLAIFPLARAQSITVRQGPLRRALRVGTIAVNCIPGQVSNDLGAVDRDALLALFTDAEHAALAAVRADRSHRWAGASVVSPSHLLPGPGGAAYQGSEVLPAALRAPGAGVPAAGSAAIGQRDAGSPDAAARDGAAAEDGAVDTAAPEAGA